MFHREVSYHRNSFFWKRNSGEYFDRGELDSDIRQDQLRNCDQKSVCHLESLLFTSGTFVSNRNNFRYSLQHYIILI